MSAEYLCAEQTDPANQTCPIPGKEKYTKTRILKIAHSRLLRSNSRLWKKIHGCDVRIRIWYINK